MDKTPNGGGGGGGKEPERVVVNGYVLTRTLGQGTYGKVRLGEHVEDGSRVAVKVIEKAQIHSDKHVSRIQREIRFLKLLFHPNIVRVYDVEETPSEIYILMELASGGELFDYIVAHKRVREKEARAFFRMMLSAVDYCHQNAIIHRDLKPENLLLDSMKNLKIIDFGFGNTFQDGKYLDTFCGSPYYAAPEMILGKRYVGPEVDMWSLGVILFALLCGHLPFDEENMKVLYKKITAGDFACPDHLAPGARHLICRLLTVDPKRRATLAEVKMHEWVLERYGYPPENHLPNRPKITGPAQLNDDIVKRMESFGYSAEDVRRAYFEGDQERPDPVRSTYYLLSELLKREEVRLSNESLAPTLVAEPATVAELQQLPSPPPPGSAEKPQPPWPPRSAEKKQSPPLPLPPAPAAAAAAKSNRQHRKLAAGFNDDDGGDDRFAERAPRRNHRPRRRRDGSAPASPARAPASPMCVDPASSDSSVDDADAAAAAAAAALRDAGDVRPRGRPPAGPANRPLSAAFFPSKLMSRLSMLMAKDGSSSVQK